MLTYCATNTKSMIKRHNLKTLLAIQYKNKTQQVVYKTRLEVGIIHLTDTLEVTSISVRVQHLLVNTDKTQCITAFKLSIKLHCS